VERVARGESAGAWASALAGIDAANTAILKEDRGVAVCRATLLGRDVVLKRWDLTTLGARLKRLVRAGRADRHWRNAQWLLDRGISTARCLALATEWRAGRPRRWLVMEHIPGPTLLESLRTGATPVRRQHEIATEVGRQLAEFEALRAFNRDHKPSNLVVRDAGGGVDIAVLDCVAIQRGAHPQRMLASLAIEPMGCGVPVRAALAMRVIRSLVAHAYPDPGERAGDPLAARRVHHQLWRDAAAEVRSHGDPTPRVNPLAPR
jgi:hypothetical protein